jgi:protein-tyrosine phosphatase
VTYRIALVCLGNICRSPMAHVVLEDRLQKAGLDAEVTVMSGGTGGWHEGESMDARAASVLRDAGYDPTRHRVRTFSADWYTHNDLLLAMDAVNYAEMSDQAPTDDHLDQLHMFREFDPQASEGDDEVPDPYFGAADGFDEVLATIERTADGLVARLPDLLKR